ncbi:MAG TPA: DUF3300 domain-containing protein [Stellaceae bacterium]
MSQALPFLLASPGLVAIPALAYAQQAPSAAEAQAALNPPPVQTYSQAQLDQMLAPIALYPDQVLMQVLMAATFPQQVIDAAQWLQDPNNAQIHGDALAAALGPLPWDPSVKSLVAFPQIIVMMNEHMDWTQSLGVAFASQQVPVMAEVQTLRNRAAAANQFHNNSQIRYVHSNGVWVIEPVHPNEIYIPVYNPAVVYGHWAHPDYPPVYVPPPPGFVSSGFNLGPGIAFSVGFGVVAPLWDWGHPDWRRHEVVINQTRYTHITTVNHFENNHVVIQGGAWRRTAPVMTVEAPRRAGPAPGPRPEGTAAPSTIHAPPPHPSGPGGPHPAQAPGGARPGEEHPAPGQPPHPEEAHPIPGQPPHPEEAHPTPGVPAHPGEPAHPGPEGAHPGQPPHPEEAHPTPGVAAHPGEPAHRGPEGVHPGGPPHPEEAHPTPGVAAHPGEPAHRGPEGVHPGGPPHPGPEGARPGEPPHPEPQHAAPPRPVEPPHPAPEAAHPAEPPHPAAPPAPHPVEAPHPAPPPPAAHPAPPPPAAHPAPPPQAAHPAPPPQAAHPAEPPHPEGGKPPEPPK